jgi:hypothetical protein
MGDEEKDLIQEKGPEAEQGEAVTEDSEPEQGQQEGVDSVPSNHIAEKRGRMVAAGLVERCDFHSGQGGSSGSHGEAGSRGGLEGTRHERVTIRGSGTDNRTMRKG